MEPSVWKIQKIVSKGDYNYAVVPEHPHRTKNNYVLEHRIVMENHLGRLLDSNEIVHHKNEDKKDNRPENLEVMINVEHCRMHSTVGCLMVEMICPNCNNIFVIEKRQSHLSKKNKRYTTCSRRCGNLFARILSQGITPEVEEAISGNLVREFNSLDNPEETVLQQDP
jgi:hypothetical protein